MRTTPAGLSRCSEGGAAVAAAAARALRVAACWLAVGGAAAFAQNDPLPQGPVKPPVPVRPDGSDVYLDESLRALQKKLVRSIQIEKTTPDGKPLPLDAASAESIVRSLRTSVGRPFEARNVTADCQSLWNERRIVASAYAQEVDDEVVVRFVVEREIEVYEGVEFLGLHSLSRSDVDALLGLHADRKVTRTEAEAMRKVLLTKYRREGYAFCSIELQERPAVDADVAADAKPRRPRNVVNLRIDEGPKVTIRSMTFVGNKSFAAEPHLGLFGAADYLLRDSHIQSDPRRGFSMGGAYSRELLEEDLDRLRLFYRSRGFLEATVDIGDVQFSEGRSSVDVSLVVVEGPRYKIKSVRVEHVDEQGQPLTVPSLYPPAEVLGVCKVQPGEFYDHDRLQRDRLAIEDFYGKRGHPPSSFPGMNAVHHGSTVLPLREVYGSGPEVEIVHQVVEGVPKRLRDVVIRGNRFTRDHVIRRRVRVLPGDRIDMTEVNRALRSIEQTRFFQDPTTMRQPRFQLEPVRDADDLVDLGIDLEDAPTGELKWGVSISTGQGAGAQVSYNKRNFDLWNPPSSINPITALGEIVENKAFHGGGQTLNMLLAPGTRVSQFSLTFIEPDVFRQYFQTWELRVAGVRQIRHWTDGYVSDKLGAQVGLSHNFSDEFSVGASLRNDSIKIDDLALDASSLAFDAEGRTELRGLQLRTGYRDLDDLRRPTSGFELSLSGEMVGGFLGGEESFTKLLHTGQVFVPVAENEMGHRSVLHLEQTFGVAHAFGGSDDVFLTERFYMGGNNLRGFDFRGAGPTQFQRPIGGEATYTAAIELFVPLVATRLEGEVRDRELLRGVLFTDFGLLGLSIDDPSFGELRAATGFGIRIEVPYFDLPIALDFGWPWLYEDTDERRVLYFSIGR